ncbi:29283_t:CDS:2 [Racocetra persica]|uniref:29283_t:CDS:1 n=1 Tax=Racocetra persica TaxID=160502 RepID=A0ACA9LYX8_9GLOM|nr:29283_t:CDS:2 [Racocetra persica]
MEISSDKRTLKTEVKKHSPRYMCDGCLMELFFRYKKEFKELIKNPKKRNLLGVYINEGIIGVKKPFFLLPE